MKQLKIKGNSKSHISLHDDMLIKVELILILEAQQRFYYDELSGLGTKGFKLSGPLHKLDPFIPSGILRVGRRLTRYSIVPDSKHQMLIPPKVSTHTTHSPTCTHKGGSPSKECDDSGNVENVLDT